MSESKHESNEESNTAAEFERQAAQPEPGLLAEFRDFLIHNKKWWLAPIIIVLLLLGALLVLGGSAWAPLIYPLF